MTAPKSSYETDFTAQAKSNDVPELVVAPSGGAEKGDGPERYQTREDLEKALNEAKKSEGHLRLVKLGCKGPVVKCNVPVRGWINGIGGCPNVGGICMACTMPGFPDKYMPFMDVDAYGNLASNFEKFAFGPVVRYFRRRNIKNKYDVEPTWRKRADRLETGYQARNYG